MKEFLPENNTYARFTQEMKKALNCFVTAASIFILLSEQKHIINMLLSKK